MRIVVALLAFQGSLGRFCERVLASAVRDDPYQFEQTDRTWLLDEIERLEIRETWGRLTTEDASMLKIMRAEMARRTWLAEFLK